MKIKYLKSFIGEKKINAGDIGDVKTASAEKLVGLGMAEYVADEPKKKAPAKKTAKKVVKKTAKKKATKKK